MANGKDPASISGGVCKKRFGENAVFHQAEIIPSWTTCHFTDYELPGLKDIYVYQVRWQKQYMRRL